MATVGPPETVGRDAAAPEVVGAGTQAGAPIQRGSLWRDAWRRYVQNKGAVVAGSIFLAIVLFCVFWPIISPYDPNEQDLSASRQSPARAHTVRRASWSGTSPAPR